MRHFSVTSLFVLLLTFVAQSQTDWDKTIFVEVGANETTTISLNLETYSSNQIGSLKDDLISFDEKVLEIRIKDQVNSMYITYNGAMLLSDLVKVFEKHHVDYLLEGRKSSIKTKAAGQ